MRFRGGIFALSLAAVALVAAAPASAASTRAEYVAQVDPICQAAIKPETKAFNAYLKSLDHFNQRVASGHITKRTFTKLLAQTAGFLSRFNRIGANVTTQIEAVPPPPGDSGTVTLWIQDRRASEQLATSAVSALRHRRIKAYSRLLAESTAVYQEAGLLVSSFGFQYCA